MNFDANRNFIISEGELIEIFSGAFQRMLSEDQDLFEAKASELTLVPRLAMYLRDSLIASADIENNGVKIDLEYGRSGNHSKDPCMGHSTGKKHWIRPDLLIHERGSDDYSENEKHKNNILYCEVKEKEESNNDDSKKVELQVENRKYHYGINLYYFTREKIELTLYTRNFETTKISSTCYYYDMEKDQLLPKRM